LPGSLVAQYVVSPSGAKTPNTRTNPNPGIHTGVLSASITVSASDRVPSRSLFINRFAFSRVSHIHPHARIAFRFSSLPRRSLGLLQRDGIDGVGQLSRRCRDNLRAIIPHGVIGVFAPARGSENR